MDLADASADPRLATMTGYLGYDDPARLASVVAEAAGGTAVDDARLGPAVPEPARILCIGVNYLEHAAEAGQIAKRWPEVFVRGAGSVVGPYDDLVLPALCDGFDYEGELGAVVGRGGRYIPADQALGALAGFVVLNDASARDWQSAGTQWTAGKNFDGTMPIGPELVTPDEVDVTNLELTTTLNGEVMQSANTSQMIVDVASCVEFLSSFTTLRPGDVIATGTPGGVGFARKPPVWLTPGDVVEVTVHGVGTIRNTVVKEAAAPDAWRWRPTNSQTITI
ncbi:MAG TPA: fumarylacetoacetate hydrolase family protein [Nocardioidaceae bacterium]|nr:fumarylacetoacetate hydrolase family protein [Nocardioidaceae bacterium]